MQNKALDEYTLEDISGLVQQNVDAIVLVDTTQGVYKAVKRDGIFHSFIDETGEYNELIEKLWFHFNGTNDETGRLFRS